LAPKAGRERQVGVVGEEWAGEAGILDLLVNLGNEQGAPETSEKDDSSEHPGVRHGI
jgi:hypothetical protein